MTKLLHYTTEDWIALVAQITMYASLVRLALHWLRNLPLLNLIPASSSFWKAYDAVEATMSYVAISLSAFGKKTAESTPMATVVKAASPAEGQIEADSETTPKV